MMLMNRRRFIKHSLSGLAAALAFSGPLSGYALAGNTAKPAIRAVAFDAFPVFDPRPVFALVKDLFPEQGDALSRLWFTKIFGYTWLRTSAGRYQSFDSVIENALLFSTKSLGLELTPENRRQLLQIWFNLKTWPDAEDALHRLHSRDIRLCFLSNMTENMLRANARNSGIEDLFEYYLSTDRVHVFKPHPDAYRMGEDALGLPKEQIAFAAFAGWDAAGAGWYGYPAIWVNRLNAKAEELGPAPAVTGSDMSHLENFVSAP